MTYDDVYNMYCDFSRNCLEMASFYKTSRWIGIDISFNDVYIGFLSDLVPCVIYYDKGYTDEQSFVGANEFAWDLVKVRRLEKEKQPDKEFVPENTVQAVLGISEDYSDKEKQKLLEKANQVGFDNAQLLYKTYAAAIAKYWDEKNTAEKTIASCVFREQSFGISIITIKDGVFYVKNRGGIDGTLDNYAVKGVCLETIRQIDLKAIDEVLLVGQKDFVTKDKPFIKAARTAFRKLFEGECKYVRGHENLVAKGLALYGNSLDEQEPVIFEMPKESGVYNE